MSDDSQLDKDRLYFTQNNKPIRLRCPECVRTAKSLRHCQVFKNLPALWWHIKRIHGYFVNLLFNTDDVIDLLNAVSKARDLGIIPDPAPVYVEATTSSSLKYNGRPPRKDVYQKLNEIAALLKNQSNSYPNFTLKQLRVLSGVVLKQVDDRTIQKYIDSIIEQSEKNIRNGTIDASGFCEEFD